MLSWLSAGLIPTLAKFCTNLVLALCRFCLHLSTEDHKFKADPLPYLFFPQLYILAEGNCLFHGTVQDLIPYLAVEGLVCPKYHNPADYSKYLQGI